MTATGHRLTGLSLVVALLTAVRPEVRTQGLHPHTPVVSGAPDGIPLFCAQPSVATVNNGPWSDPATWSTLRVPRGNDRVRIDARHTVSYDVSSDEALACVEVQGRLAFSTTRHTRMTVITLMVLEDGALEIGTPGNPLPEHVTAEVVIADRPFDVAMDPHQFGHGVVALGRVTLQGAPKSPTFLRLAREARAGERTLTVEHAVEGWRQGDRLVLPDTRRLLQPGERGVNEDAQDETVEIASVSGSEITLAAPLAFNHLDGRDARGRIGFLPHVGNLSRNIVVRSENPAGVRGHTIFVSRSDVDIRYAAFRDLGRTRHGPLDNTHLGPPGQLTHIGTNQIGRYAVHFHHTFGPRVRPANGYQFTLVGNAVENSPKWGVTVHQSHYGLVQHNVVYRTRGAAVVAEDGTESFNVFDHNFSVRIEGSSEPGERSQYGGPAADDGDEGSGFWFRGPNNYIRNNVVANGDAYGYALAPYSSGLVRFPRFQGADTSLPTEGVLVDTQGAAVLEFSSNEAYGTPQSFSWCLGCPGYPAWAGSDRPAADSGSPQRGSKP